MNASSKKNLMHIMEKDKSDTTSRQQVKVATSMDDKEKKRKIKTIAYRIGIIGDRHIVKLKRSRIDRQRKERRKLVGMSMFLALLLAAAILHNRQIKC